MYEHRHYVYVYKLQFSNLPQPFFDMFNLRYIVFFVLMNEVDEFPFAVEVSFITGLLCSFVTGQQLALKP